MGDGEVGGWGVSINRIGSRGLVEAGEVWTGRGLGGGWGIRVPSVELAILRYTKMSISFFF